MPDTLSPLESGNVYREILPHLATDTLSLLESGNVYREILPHLATDIDDEYRQMAFCGFEKYTIRGMAKMKTPGVVISERTLSAF